MREGRKNGYEQREADRRMRQDIERQNMTRKERKEAKSAKRSGSRQSAQETKNSLELLMCLWTVSGAARYIDIFR